MRCRVLTLVAITAVLHGEQARAEGPPKNGIRWERDYDEAFAEAKERHVPVMIAFVQDGEAQNDEEPAVVYPDAKVIKASRALVCMIASRGAAKDHGEVTVTERGNKTRNVCSKFGSVACLDHQKIETVAFREYTNGSINTPCHIFTSPDGKEMFREDDYVDAAALMRLMKQATDKLGPGIAAEDYEQLQQTLKDGESLFATKAYGAAATKYLALSAKALKIPAVDRARERLTEIDRLGANEIASADQKTQAKDWVGAYTTLARVSIVFKGLRADKEARNRLTDLEKNAAAAEVHKLAVLEEKARPMLAQAESFTQKGQPDKAEALYRKIVQTYPATPSASIARDRVGIGELPPAPPKDACKR